MNANEMQNSLEAGYAEWRTSLHLSDEAAQLSAPLLLSVTPAYVSAKRRILFVGQETYGWNWTRDLRSRYPQYPVDYPYGDIQTMQDFISVRDAVEALCWGYREFNFSSKQPINWRSPFWQAFREVQEWPDSGLMWNNLCRCDYQDGSMLKAPEDLQLRLAESQRGLMAKELEILQPHVCLFVTGPDYDELLSEVFPESQLVPIGSIPVRQLARIQHPHLPANSFRTYHPNYLSRAQHWDFLAQMRDLIVADI